MDSGSPLRYGRNDVFLIARLILKQSGSLNGFTDRFRWDFLEDSGNRENTKREGKTGQSKEPVKLQVLLSANSTPIDSPA